MSIERILAVTSAGPLLGGLSWRPAAGGRHSLRRLHEARNLTTDATHYVLLTIDHAVVYGLFQPRASEESVRLGKGVQAAAHCFATRVGAEAPNGALLLTVPPDGQRKDERVYVVVLEDGVPVVDSLTSEMEARNALGSEDRPLWSDTPSLYPNCQPVDVEWLAGAAGKASRVTPIPLNPWPIVLVGLLLATGFGAWHAVREARRLEAAEEEARRLAEADPVPRYLSALASRRGAMATDRDGWSEVLRQMFERPVAVPGWRMRSTECDAAARRCDTVWARQGGTFADLASALPGEALQLQTAATNPVPALDQALTTRAIDVARRPLPAMAHRLPTLPEALRQDGSHLQVWKTANLAVDLKAPQLWPRVDAVPAGFEHPDAVLSGVFSVGDVPGPFVQEALRTAPAWVSWESVRADIGEGDALSRLKFKVMGVYYVSLR